MISFKNVNLIYDNDVQALNNINFRINKGEFVFLVGTSGSGKSSLIKTILKEINCTSGDINVNSQSIKELKNKDIPYFRRKLGVIFQDFRLLNEKTVYENVATAMKVVEADENNIKKKVPIVLEKVGLKNKLNCYPRELSGGEQQRVAIARAIVNDPLLILADEPTGNLDPETTLEILKILNEVNKSGTTILMATHDKEVVNNMRKRVISMKNGNIIHDNIEGGYKL